MSINPNALYFCNKNYKRPINRSRVVLTSYYVKSVLFTIQIPIIIIYVYYQSMWLIYYVFIIIIISSEGALTLYCI